MCIDLYSRMGCRQDLNIRNSQQQETGLAAAPNMYYVIVYPREECMTCRSSGGI